MKLLLMVVAAVERKWRMFFKAYIKAVGKDCRIYGYNKDPQTHRSVIFTVSDFHLHSAF